MINEFCNRSLTILTVGLVLLTSTCLAAKDEVVVASADPASAEQGTVNLDVDIGGQGFDQSAEVRFLVAGSNKDTGGIVVNHVTFQDSTRLTANIDIASEAIVADFDVEVRMSRGRGGKGTTLFKVQKKAETIVTLTITYEFGTPTAGLCSAPDCRSTSITATGTVECTNLYCDFTSTSVMDVFNLPSDLRDLLFATQWRGTPLDPDQCFGSSPADPGGGAALIDDTPVFIRRFDDGVTPWFAKVDALASDIEGIGVRQYGFNFEGCGADSCGAFAPGSMAGAYEGGELVSIGVPGNDRKFAAVPCRCTRSNTPDCPDDVSVPTPPMRIIVSEVP